MGQGMSAVGTLAMICELAKALEQLGVFFETYFSSAGKTQNMVMEGRNLKHVFFRTKRIE